MELSTPVAASVSDRAAGGRAAFILTAAALLVLIAGTEVPTPLYVPYRARFGLSTTELTLLFATYAVALIPSLLGVGIIADASSMFTAVLSFAAGIGALGLVTAGWILRSNRRPGSPRTGCRTWRRSR